MAFIKHLIVHCAFACFAMPLSAQLETRPVEQVVNPDSFNERLKALDSETLYSQSCCKQCRKGKACGNSCISKSYTCRKGKGCACDG